MIASVKSTRFRRSVTCHRFLSGLLSIAYDPSGAPYGAPLHTGTGGALRPANHLRGATGRRNLLRRLAAELVRPHGQLLRDVAARQHLDLPAAAHDAALAQQFRRDDGVGVEPLGERVEVDHDVLRAERVVEAALRHAPMQRHLPAFEAALELVAGARLCALVPAARLRALAGAVPAADALLRVLRSGGWFERALIHFPLAGPKGPALHYPESPASNQDRPGLFRPATPPPPRDGGPLKSSHVSRAYRAVPPSGGCGAAPSPPR